MNKVAVVILNWNGQAFLEQFLPSIVKHSSADAQVYVADNASTDHSVAYVKTHFPQIEIIQNTHNYGFSKGYNMALQQIKAPYFVLLNSDVEVTENWIAPIIQLMDSDENIAACQPKIKDYNNKAYFEYAGAAGGFIDYLGYPLCRGRVFNHLEEDQGQYEEECEIFWATGACMFVRASVFNELGGLDDHFFAHMEEIDLCWRMKNSGYKVMYSPNATVYHVGGGTLNKINPKKTYLNFRNNLFLLHKNLPKEKRFITIFQRLLLDGLAGVKLFLEGKPKHTLAIVKAHVHFYQEMKQNKQKRLLNSTPNNVGIIDRNILFLSFFKGKKTFTEIIND